MPNQIVDLWALVGGFTVIFIFIIYALVTRYKETHAHGIVVPQYEPPRGLPPVALSQIMDGSIEMRDIIAEIIDLSIKGYIRIEHRDSTLVLYRQTGSLPISDFEFKFLDKLFSGMEGMVFD